MLPYKIVIGEVIFINKWKLLELSNNQKNVIQNRNKRHPN
jgi:hypothetical protein